MVVLCTHTIEGTKYTAKELEELRRFYYDDDEVYGDVDSTEHQGDNPAGDSKASKKPEPRSKSKTNKDNNTKSNESSEDERPIGPGDFIKDARKYVNAGRKAIDRAAQRVLPPLPSAPPFLPRIRASRASKKVTISEEKANGRSESSPEDVGTVMDETRHSEEEVSKKELSPGDSQRKGGVQRVFKNPFENLQKHAAEVAADTGGKILSILNKLTPRPIPGLPTPIPNLEDFGG